MPGTRLLTDSTVFQNAVAQINTPQVNLVAANMTAVTAAATNMAAIINAPTAATNAAASAASAATAIASVPIGAATYIEASGPPGANIGTAGAYYYDPVNYYAYGPKTAAGWPAGIYVGPRKSLSPTRVRYDFRTPGATLPANFLTCTRNSTSTDMLPSDPYNYAYNTYAANTVILRPGKGIMGGAKRASQLLANPTAPVVSPTVETLTVSVGNVVCVGWGPAGSSYTVTAGTAAGTGFGTFAGDSGQPISITITTAGTITFTSTGGLAKANVLQNPSLPSGTEVVPFIPTQSIREADQYAMGSAFLAAFQSPQGYVSMYISDMAVLNYGSSSTIFALNGTAAQIANSVSATAVYDPVFHTTGTPLGSGNFKTGVTIARTWDGTSTMTFGAGDALEVTHPFPFNNGAAVTSGAMFCKGLNNIAGDQNNFCCLGLIEWDTAARLTDEQLYAKYTSFLLPQMVDIVKNLQGPQQFKKFLTAYRQCQAGIIDHVRVADMGSSHHAGTGGSVNVRGNATTAQMVADMKLDGLYAVNDDCFGGMNSFAWATGGNSFDGRMSYLNGTPTQTYNQSGVGCIRIPAGAQITFTPALANARLRLAHYTGTGNGQLQVSIDGGITPLAADEGTPASLPTASSTFTGSITNGVLSVTTAPTVDPLVVGDYISGTAIPAGTIITGFLTATGGTGTYSTNAATTLNVPSEPMSAANIKVKNFTRPLGVNNWTMKAVGGNVDISWGYTYDPAGKQIVFGNFGCYAYTSPGLSLDAAPGQSVQLPVRRFGPHLAFGCSDDTNSYNTGVTATAWTTAVASILASLQQTADVILYTDPPTSTTVTVQPVQDAIYDCARAFAFQNNLPMFDFAAWAVSRSRLPSGTYDDNIHIGKRMIKRMKSNPQKTLLYTIISYAAKTDPTVLQNAIAQLNTPQVNALAASIAAITSVSNNLTAITSAPVSAATSAAAALASANNATAAVASVPVGAATYIEGHGPPSLNAGTTGAFFYDADAGYLYGPKTALGWPAGSYVARASLSAATIYDFRYGSFPSTLAVTRAQPTTDALYSDNPGRPYNIIPAGAPCLRADMGGVGFFQSSRNYLLNSTAPATQTLTLAVGKYTLWGNGTGSLVISTGTAVATSIYGPAVGSGLNLADRSYQQINVTTAGTVTVTVAGNCNWFQLENNPLAMGATVATPLIITTTVAVTRDGDVPVMSGSLLAFFQASAGTVIIESASQQLATGSTKAALLSFNGGSSISVAADQTTKYYDGASFSGTQSLGDSSYSAGKVRTALSWSGTTCTLGAGTPTPRACATTFANGVAITTGYLGTDGSTTNATNSFNGWISRIELYPTRLSDSALNLAYTALPPIGPSIIENLTSSKMPKWRAAKREVLAGVRDGFIIAVGTSHTAGTNPVTNTKAFAWPALLAAQLNARGIPASDNAVFGNGTQPPNAGVSVYDSRVTFSSGCTAWGTALNQGLRWAAGGTVDFAPTGTTTTITIIYYTNTTYGSIDVSANGGATISSINCAGAASIQAASVTTTSGTNTFRLTMTGEVIIAGFYVTNSATKQFIVINAGIIGARAAALANEAGLQNSISAVMGLVPPDVMFYECVTNDATALTAQSAYRTSVQYTIGLGKTYGDVVVLSDPATQDTGGVSPIPTSVQKTYTAIQLSTALKNDCVIADFYAAMVGGWAAWQKAGYYNGTDQFHFNSTWGYPMYASIAAATLP